MSEKPAAVEMDEMDMDMDDDEAYVRPVSAQKPVVSAPVLRGLPSRQPSTAPAQPSKPLTKVEQLRQKIQNDLYDSDAWNQLVLEYQNRPIAEARETYEEFLRVFPTAGRWWKYYAEQEISARNFDAAEKIFMRCLPSCPSVDLWKSYIKYVLDHKAKLPNSKDLIIHAFEYTLANVGLDISATSIWVDYINYLKSIPTTITFTDSHKMDLLRKVYQRAIENPMHNLESIWKEYDQFENSLNKTLAAGLLKEHGPKYMSARSTYRERKNHIEGISKNVLARPPRGYVREAHQLKLWKRLIDYEKSNPQRLDTDALHERVTFTFNQALTALYHYPEIWHQAAQYQLDSGHADASEKVYSRALLAMPTSLLIHFEYCDFLELTGKISEATALYDKLISSQPSSLVWIQAMRFFRRSQGIQSARKMFFKARKSPTCTYHVYVAAALLEFYVNKDDKVARNILELGSKKFANDSAFLLQYIDFLFHRNEENDMRVLFEKVLSIMPKDKSVEVWNLFLKFEMLVGNLDAMTKVEKRRSQAYPEMDPSGILGVVQRYRFLDLWPCSNEVLSSFSSAEAEAKAGKKGGAASSSSSVTAASSSSSFNAHNKSDDMEVDEEPIVQRSHFGASFKKIATVSKSVARPDLSQLTLYNAVDNSAMGRGGMQGGPGGPRQGSMLSAALSQFMSSLPPPQAWDGPIVDIEKLIASIRDAPYEKLFQPVAPANPGQSAASNAKQLPDELSDDEDGPGADAGGLKRGANTADIFKKRMMKKFKPNS